jgi:hypothetical protein
MLKLHPLKISLLVLVAALAVPGCTTTQTAALGSIATAVMPVASTLVDTAVTLAVTAELLKDPATTHAKAVAFAAIAQQVATDTSSPAVTVAQLEGMLNTKLVALAPDPVTKASVIALIGGLQNALNNVIGANTSGPITQNTLVAINGIAKQVIQVTSFY